MRDERGGESLVGALGVRALRGRGLPEGALGVRALRGRGLLRDPGVRRAMALAAALVVGGVVLAGCADGSGSGGSGGSTSAAGSWSVPRLTGVLAQNREDEVRGVVAVRLTAQGEPVTVRRIALTWDGLEPAAAVAPNYPLSPGVPADLPVPFGRARCGTPPDAAATPPDASPRATLTVERGGATSDVDVPLTADGDLLRRLFTTSCRQQALAAVVDVRMGDRWTAVSSGGRPALRGSVDLTRRDGDAWLRVTAVDGSVLLSIRPASPGAEPLLTVAPGTARGSLPVVVTSSGRCDGHALGESKKTYVFTVTVDAGSGPLAVDVSPRDPADRAAMWRVVTASCGVP